MEQDLQNRIEAQLKELQGYKPPEQEKLEQMMKEFKPKQLSKEELDNQIQIKLKLKHPELFLTKEESEKWLT